MSIQIRDRDPQSRRAYGESIGPAARAVVTAVAASTTALQTVMNRDRRYPADPRAAFSALIACRRAQAEIDAAVAEYVAWLIVGGVTRSALARGLGVRPATLARMLAPAEHIASARGADLVQTTDGSWTAYRLDPPPVPEAADRVPVAADTLADVTR